MQLINAWQQIQEKAQLPPMNIGAARLQKQEIIDDLEAVWAAFEQCNPAQGWLQFQSHQMHFMDSLPEPKTEWGLLLNAEAVDGQGQSLVLRQNGKGGWILSAYRHDEHGDGLWDEVSHRLHGINGQLRYRRYWKKEANRGVVQHLACLIAIESMKDTDREKDQ